MKSGTWGWLVAVLAVAGSFAMVRADDATPPATPTTQPSPDTDAPRAKVRLFKPYSLLSDLTDDQKAQIAAIHKTYNEALAALKQKQTDDIAAILTDDQKKELAADETDSTDQAKAEKKETDLSNKVNADQEKLDKAKAAAGDSNDND
jgi:hypothetical protein